MREVAADQRLQRLAQLAEAAAAGRAPARARESSTDPITPVRLNSARSVGVSTITSATSPEKLMSLAPIDSSTRSSLRSGWRCFAAVSASRNSVSCALTVPWQVPRFRRRAFPRALRAEQAVGDGGAGAGERQIGHRDMRISHRERERGAGLVAVQRAMAGGIEPERAVALPVLQRVRRLAGAAAFVAGAARTVILRARACRDRSGSRSPHRPTRSAGPDCLRRRRCCRRGRR